MPDSLIVILFVLMGSTLVLGLLLLLRFLTKVNREVKVLKKQIEVLQTENKVLRKEISVLKSALSESSNPLFDLPEYVQAIKNKGILPALTLIGTRLLQSYFKSRRVKSLATPKKD